MDDYRLLAEDPEWVEYQEAHRTSRGGRVMAGSVPMTNPDAVVLRDLTDPAVQAEIRARVEETVIRSRERRIRRQARLDAIADLTARTGGYQDEF